MSAYLMGVAGLMQTIDTEGSEKDRNLLVRVVSRMGFRSVDEAQLYLNLKGNRIVNDIEPGCRNKDDFADQWGGDQFLPAYAKVCLTNDPPETLTDRAEEISAVFGYFVGREQRDYRANCSATLIDERTALTARHCMEIRQYCNAAQDDRLFIYVPATGLFQNVRIDTQDAAFGGVCGTATAPAYQALAGQSLPDLLVLRPMDGGTGFGALPDVNLVEDPVAFESAQIGGFSNLMNQGSWVDELGDLGSRFYWQRGGQNACYVFMPGDGCVTHLCSTAGGYSGAPLMSIDPTRGEAAVNVLAVHSGAPQRCRQNDEALEAMIRLMELADYDYELYNEGEGARTIRAHIEAVSQPS